MTPSLAEQTDPLKRAKEALDHCGEMFNYHDEQIRLDERNKVLDEYGILHGEDAIRFHEAMNNPEPLNERAQEIIKQAMDLVNEERRAKETCPQNKVWGHCPVAGQIRQDEQKKIYIKLYEFCDSFKISIHVDELGKFIETLKQNGEI